MTEPIFKIEYQTYNKESKKPKRRPTYGGNKRSKQQHFNSPRGPSTE